MQWIRSHLSFANVISVVALFVAMGGTGYAAAQLARNSVGAKQIKKNAVRAGEIRRNAVGASELRSNAVAGGDIADGGVGSLDLGANAVGTAKVADDSLTAVDIIGSSLDSEVGPDLFARVATDGTLQPNVAGFPPQVKGIDPADVVKGEAAAATGNYCFGDLGGPIASAQVTLDNADAAAANRNLIASVAIDRGEDLGDCPPTHNQARVRIVDGTTEAPTDARFFIWIER